jgi:hypothetical protein
VNEFLTMSLRDPVEVPERIEDAGSDGENEFAV